jgi:predicted nucleic acid-binding protein
LAELPAVNTSPVLYLARSGYLHLLQIAGDKIAVPAAVATEIRTWHTADAAATALEMEPWLCIVDSEPIPPVVAVWDLGAGESAVIAYGLVRPAALLIIDDLAARRCAASLGVQVRGTLGLVLAAKRRGLIPVARRVLHDLRASGMYLSSELVDRALREVRE